MEEFYQLLLSSIQSCSQVVLLCLTGYIAASLDIINSSLQKGLSSLIIRIFMPCLLFSNIAADIDLETLMRLWPIPTLYIIFTILSALLGGIGGNLLKLTFSDTKFLMTSIIFNNVTSLGLGLLEGMESTKSIEILFRDEYDSPKEAVKRGMSYVLLATLLGNLSRWSLGTYLLKKNSAQEVSSSEPVSQRPISQSLPIYNNDERTFVSERSPLIIKSIEKKGISIGAKILRPICKLFKIINGFMNPPLYAAILALVIGTVPFLKGIFFGVNAPLYPTITRTLEHLGKISIPLTLLTLGAQLKNLPRASAKEMFPQISYVMICRFLLMPVFGIILIALTKDYYINDPMLWFVLMLMASGPPAVNCMNMTSFTGTFEGEMATLLFYSYAAVGPLMAAAVMIMLNVIEKSK